MIFERHKKKIWPILSILFVILIIGFISNFNIGNIIKVNNLAYVYSVGDGSSGNPYQITSWTDLNGVRDDLTAYYKLVENLSSTTAGYGDYGDDWIPIGHGEIWDNDGNLVELADPFMGNFNGNNKTISDLIINEAGIFHVGLFGYTTGDVSNVGLINVNVTNIEAYTLIGSLVGWQAGGTITNSYSTGSVSGQGTVGGLVGYKDSGTISNSYSTCSVTGNYSTGGLVGEQDDGTITNSYSTGIVAGTYDVGGFMGLAYGGTITNSFWDKTTSGKNVMCGSGSCDNTKGKTTAQMKTLATFSGASWDISDNVNYLNNGYPYLSGTTPVWYIASKFADGDGTELDPYQIGTWIHLNNVRDYLSSYFIMIDNLSSTTPNYDTLGNNWTPIGDNGNRFTGSFNGNGKTISDLIINKPGVDYVGLFGFLSDDYSTGSISNLGLINVNITGGEYVGSLAGFSFTGGTITKSYSTGIVTGSSSVGGLIGEMYAGTITKSYSSGSVTGTVNYVGGIVGFQRNGTIENSYSTKIVTGSSSVGGFVGFCAGTITNSYSIGSVTGDTSVGGFIGVSAGTINNSYWDTQTSGQATSTGGTGKTTVQMMILSTFTDASWDISQGADENNGYPYLGWQASNNSYVWLTPGENLFAGGDGSSGNPYQINSWIGLDAMRDSLTANYILVGNLSSSSANYSILGNDWTPIGSSETLFSGSLNGGGKTISDLIINKPEVDYVGLFGYVSGSISNIGLINASVTGMADVGGLAGAISGTITNSYSSGTIVGSGTLGHGSNIGGLVGLSQLGEITKSYSSGSVTGSGEYIYSVGGLVGRQSFGTTTNSYSTANVTGPAGSTGGLVGYSSFGIISNSYSVGSVINIGGGGLVGYSSSETITNSFWDTQTSGETLSDGGTGKTTVKMKGLYTYNLNGGNWDISGGAPDLNNGYPYLTGSTSPIWLIPSTVAIDPTLHRRPTHSECDLQGQCVSVSGSGSNQCTLDMDCLLSATTTATTTPIVCSLGNDCGASNYTDMPFCQDNNVYQNYVNYSCNNASTTASSCSSTTVAQLKTTCLSNQTCISGECVNKIIRRKQLEEVVCGDNVCSQTESCNSCSLDCGECSITDLITGSKNVSDLKPAGNEIVETDIKTGIGQDQASNNIVESVISNIVKSFTTESIKGNIETVTKNVDNIVNSYAGEIVTKTVSTGGAVTAIAITAGTVSFSVSDIILLIIRSFHLLLTVFGLRKRVSPWGVVYDSITKQPLDPAYVVLKNMKGKEVSSAITDLDGRFGFLVEPGIYKLKVQKTNYIFPSQKLAGKINDELYRDLYFGENLEVKTLGEVIIKNIPLDPVNFDWNEFAKRDKGLMKFYSKWDIVKREFFDWFFVIGFIFSSISYIFTPYQYNLILMTLYVFLSLIIIFGLKPKTYGYIKEKETGFPLSFAIVRVFLSGSDTIIASKTTDKYGKYYCLVPPGKYYIKVEKKNDDGSYSTLYTSSDIDVTKKGIINENFRL